MAIRSKNKKNTISYFFLYKDSTYKSLTQIQIAAYRMSERRLGAIDSKLQRKLVDLLKVASKAKNTEKMNELIGKLLFVTYKLVRKLRYFK